MIMNFQRILILILLLFIQKSYQHNATIVCDYTFSCVISGVSNTSELIQLKKIISSGVYVNHDDTSLFNEVPFRFFEDSLFEEFEEITFGSDLNSGKQINISQIIKISFINSNFQELPEGFFNETLFASLKTIDLSGVGLQKINLAKFNMIEVLDISNNELTSVEISGHFKNTKIKFVNLKKNYWNCSYLTKLLESLSALDLKQTEITQNEVHGCNILGIECFCSIGNQIDMKINEIFKAFKDQDIQHELVLDAFNGIKQNVENMEKRFNENSLKLQSTISSIQTIGNTCNNTADMDLIIEEIDENLEENFQLSMHTENAKDIMAILNITGQTLKVVRIKLTTKVSELEAIVTQRWSMDPLVSSKEPETSTLWLWIVLVLIVVALVTYIWIYHRT